MNLTYNIPKMNCKGQGYQKFVDMVFAQFSGHLSAVTLTFDLLTQTSNQHIYEPKYTCDQNWVKLSSLVFEIWLSLIHISEPTRPY